MNQLTETVITVLFIIFLFFLFDGEPDVYDLLHDKAILYLKESK